MTQEEYQDVIKQLEAADYFAEIEPEDSNDPDWPTFEQVYPEDVQSWINSFNY
jgi:hypothetical protein